MQNAARWLCWHFHEGKRYLWKVAFHFRSSILISIEGSRCWKWRPLWSLKKRKKRKVSLILSDNKTAAHIFPSKFEVVFKLTYSPLLFVQPNPSPTQNQTTPLLFDNQRKTQSKTTLFSLTIKAKPIQNTSPLFSLTTKAKPSQNTSPPSSLTTKAQPNQNHSHISTPFPLSLTTKAKPNRNYPPPPPHTFDNQSPAQSESLSPIHPRLFNNRSQTQSESTPPPPAPPHPFRQPKPSPLRVKLTWQDDGLLGPAVGPVELLQHRQVVGANIRGGVQSAVRPLRVHAAVHARAPGRYVQLQGVFHLSRGALRVKLYHHPPHSVGELQLGTANTKTYTHTHTHTHTHPHTHTHTTHRTYTEFMS